MMFLKDWKINLNVQCKDHIYCIYVYNDIHKIVLKIRKIDNIYTGPNDKEGIRHHWNEISGQLNLLS